MKKIFYVIAIFLIYTANVFAVSVAPKTGQPTGQQQVVDSTKQQSSGIRQDTAGKTPQNLQIDTAINRTQQPSPTAIVPVDTVRKIDSTQIEQTSENTMTNTKLFIYILLSVSGLALFFYIFVITLFKTFHKKKSTRQSQQLSWSLFFIVSIIWILIIWGLVAGFWTAASFMIVVIFLFIISLIMTIIAVKSK